MTSHESASLRIACFGTSLMKDRDSRVLTYPHVFEQRMHTDSPDLEIVLENHAAGGSTSRDVRRTVTNVAANGTRYDLAVVGCGVNDVWRRFQERLDEAVTIDEYAANYTAILEALARVATHLIVMLEPPTALPEADEMNAELQRFNAVAAGLAVDRAIPVVDPWNAFIVAAGDDRTWPWTDGVHLSKTGNALMAEALYECADGIDFMSDGTS